MKWKTREVDAADLNVGDLFSYGNDTAPFYKVVHRDDKFTVLEIIRPNSHVVRHVGCSKFSFPNANVESPVRLFEPVPVPDTERN